MSLMPIDDILFKLSFFLQNSDSLDLVEVNRSLDYLNALDFKIYIDAKKDLETSLLKCCIRIPTNNALLVAKSCNVLLNYLTKCKVTLSNDNLKLLLEWLNKGINVLSDLAYLDILQVVNAIIKGHSSFFMENGKESVRFLFEELELRSCVLQPNDIKLWRVYCLRSLSKNLFKEDRLFVITELIKILYSQSTDNLLVHAKIWKTILEALDLIVPKGETKWVSWKLNEIIGLIEAGTVLGISGKAPLLPKPTVSSSYFVQETTPKPPVYQPGKKKQKSKAKRVTWLEKGVSEEITEKKDPLFPDVYNVSHLCSDSDFSDNENGQAANLLKEQAKVRHAAFNLIISLSNVYRGKQLYGYYNVLFNVLMKCLRNEPSHKIRIAVLAALGALLMHCNPLLAQAQHSEGTSFLALSGSLSELVSSLHTSVNVYLASSPPNIFLAPLLHTAMTLISVSPYHRLRPSLLSSIFTNICPYLEHKDEGVRIGSLKCINEIVSLDPATSEQKDLIVNGLKSKESQNTNQSTTPWLISFIIDLLENQDTTDSIRLTTWQLVATVCKNHFKYLENSLSPLEKLLFIDFKSSSSEVQLFATFALNKLLNSILVNSDSAGKGKLSSYNKQLWLRLLDGPLVPILQSPDLIACEGCDCLANMGSTVFNSLEEKHQILIISLIFGCIHHTIAKVRASAAHTLGVFFLFPQLPLEQFVLDSKDMLVKALRDNVPIVRIKAAWAIGNLVDFIVNNNVEYLECVNIKELLVACLDSEKDDELVKLNILRAVGNILVAFNCKDVKDKEVANLVQNSFKFLVKYTNTGTKMKMRWNACYALASAMKNKDLFFLSDTWMKGLLTNLCQVIVSCNNFKVRASACTALTSIPSRVYFGYQYTLVWTSLLDGLDNSVNMDDFKEYKHQDSLKRHLCLAICHIITLLECEDISELETTLAFRMENLKEHFVYFQYNTLPENTSSLVLAVNHVQTLLQSPAAFSHCHFLSLLKDTMSVLNE